MSEYSNSTFILLSFVIKNLFTDTGSLKSTLIGLGAFVAILVVSYVLSGGDTDITKETSEENILKLEKDAIYKLMKENLTIERLEHILETGKYLRN